ncbi:MAG TPA: shikimate dehydrogenase [candidate division Zixibacteria bacterium]|nr:shikimate dehydrogenase [candidate division Zixibacteria bacterium]
MQRLPVIGQSFTSSAFEAVQRAAIEATGLPIVIERWERKPHQLADAIAELSGREFVGALVASPHKERTAPLMSALSDDARTTGAVNVIVRGDERLRGHNTDVDGVRAGLLAILPPGQVNWPRSAVVLGAGGGARAVVAVLIGSGFQRVILFNRHLHRAEAVAAHFARSARHMELRARPWHETFLEAELSKAGLLVNASGIGVEEGTTPVPPEMLPENLYVLDLVLNHPSTPLMREAEARGGTVANGQRAFLAGSAATFKLLTGQDAPNEVMRSALAGELGIPEEGIAVVGD